MQWLNSRMPPKVAAEPPAPTATVAPKVEAPPQPKVTFRSSAKVVATRTIDVEPSEPRPNKATVAPTRAAKSTPAPIAKVTSPVATPEPTPAKTRTPKSTPTALAKLTTPVFAPEPTPMRIRSVQVLTTPRPKATASSMLAPAVTAIPPSRMLTIEPRPPVSIPSTVSGRYPWKTNIVTTVFWVGEPVSGNNFTPNHASSWDANWAQSYGGFDNPDPAARRNFIPVRFVPRQNPFYVALPYNDVTRGTTKPESRRVIPWFREAFVREGQSVCRDRWVAIRNRAGKVGYAQWSDCGPFRTDHWQYVFGNERPKPNLNKGAGLDVSPALRDYLGLSSTDVTDWKFVDFKDVPSGPWALYGQNNTFALKGSRSPKGTTTERTADNTTRLRIREL